jgi:hypothetical protein
MIQYNLARYQTGRHDRGSFGCLQMIIPVERSDVR